MAYLRESAETLGSKRSQMKQRYADVVDEVEILKADLDVVSRDLERLARGQDAELHATFTKFGKTANLQLHDAPTEEEGEGGPPRKPPSGLKLFKIPSIRQVRVFEERGTDGSIFIEGCCIGVWRWKRLDLWNFLLIYFTLGLSQLMHKLWQDHRIPFNCIFLR